MLTFLTIFYCGWRTNRDIAWETIKFTTIPLLSKSVDAITHPSNVTKHLEVPQVALMDPLTQEYRETPMTHLHTHKYTFQLPHKHTYIYVHKHRLYHAYIPFYIWE